MARIAVVGGTGYAGSHIVAEAVDRGHTVVAVQRSVPTERVSGVTYVEGTILDAPGLVEALDGVDTVIVAISPRGDMAGKVRSGIAQLADALPENVRLGVVGGAGASRVAPGGPRVVDDPNFPEAFKAEAEEMGGVAEDLESTGTAHDWFLVHPAGGFGWDNPGERTGTYRTGSDVMITNADGSSFISGADLGVVFVDEIENPRHRGERFTVGY